MPSPPPTSTLAQLNVPEEVKDWIKKSKAPLQKPDALVNDMGSESSSSAKDTALGDQLANISANLASMRNSAKLVKRGKAKVSEPVVQNEHTGAARGPAQTEDESPIACYESFPPFRRQEKKGAAKTMDLVGKSLPYIFSLGR